jgi:hypothetical protein
MIQIPRPGFIIAPDGSSAVFDRDATIAAYSTIRDSDSACKACANFRLAFDPSYLEPGIAEACAAIGIDMSKPRETTSLFYNEESRLVWYEGDFVFVGNVEEPKHGSDGSWHFYNGTRGYGDEFTEQHAAIWFQVDLPWVLDGPPGDSRWEA